MGNVTNGRIEKLTEALAPLARIAAEYLKEGLDEARPSWVQEGTEPFDGEVELYCGRGGGCLLKLSDAIRAYELLCGVFEPPAMQPLTARAQEIYELFWVPAMPKWKELSLDHRRLLVDRLQRALADQPSGAPESDPLGGAKP